MELKFEMLQYLRDAWDDHAASCCAHPKVFLLNPGNFELIGWVEVLGMPVLPDPSVAPKRVKLVRGVGFAGEFVSEPVFLDPRWGVVDDRTRPHNA